MKGIPTSADLSGAFRELARELTRIENQQPEALQRAAAAAVHGEECHVIGITGPPGAGKSTLIGTLIEAIRAQDRTVAVLAVDPSSSLTGGALLGDRIRMLRTQGDPGVYIRSLSTRGRLGGLATAIPASLATLSAAGFDVVIVETVGVGQNELDVVQLADTTVLVAIPGAGDEMQAMKAGILEVADVFVVNKADQPGAGQVERQLRRLAVAGDKDWRPPILRCVAVRDEGVPELLDAIQRHVEHLRLGFRWRDKARRRMAWAIRDHALRLVHRALEDDTVAATLLPLADQFSAGTLSLEEAARELLRTSAT